MNAIVRILLWIWQAPQNLVGLALRLWYRKRIAAVVLYDQWYNFKFRIVPDFPAGGISLASTIIVRHYYLEPGASDLYAHEYGHALQSLYLGPLYLFVIGIPSLIWAWRFNPDRGVSYYSFYTEKWADKLGNVKRQ